MADKKADSGSESDSADEPVVGNVNKFAVVPPGFSGRPKRGHLIFDACFECGNLGRVDYITEYEYDLFIRPDTCNPRFRVWFNFTVENVKSDQRVIFNIVNFSKTKSLYREGMSPFVKSTSRPKWARIPAKHVYYYRCPDHRKNYVMSFAFIFDKEEDTYQFTYCYPYSYSRLQNYLDNLEKRNMEYFSRELLCLTVQQRRLDLITITHPDNLFPEETKRIVFVTARVHPGETPSSFVCQGFIDFLISNHPVAKTLREHIVFKIVPMLNPDGVYLGNYRCSLMGFDLNRHWQEPSPWAHPTLYATKNLLLEYDRDDFTLADKVTADLAYVTQVMLSMCELQDNGKGPYTEISTLLSEYLVIQVQENIKSNLQIVLHALTVKLIVDFYIDIHAHSTLMNGFMYGNTYEDMERHDRQSVFPKLLCANAEDFSMGNTNYNRDAVKAGTGRRTLGGCLDENSHCYTLEVSFFSYQTSSTGASMPYTEEGYMKLGRNLARTFLDYYKLTGHISIKPISSIIPKPGAFRIRDRPNQERVPSEPIQYDERADNYSACTVRELQNDVNERNIMPEIRDSSNIDIDRDPLRLRDKLIDRRQPLQDDRFAGIRRQYNRTTDYSINSTSAFSDVSTSLRMRERDRRQY